MARDTKDVEAMLAALNRSVERFQALWFSFLALTLYFIITALTTTHRMLLLDEPQSLPIVNLKVPLIPFYVIAPILFIVLHFYVLLMLVLMARSAHAFNLALEQTISGAQNEQFRFRAENIPALQLLVGAKEERNGINSTFLVSILLITLGAVPVITLLVMQLQFLPYHHFAITWLHRLLVMIDTALVVLFWWGYRRRQGRIGLSWPMHAFRQRQAGWHWRLGGASLATVAALWLCLIEGRWAGEPGIDPTKRFMFRLLEGRNIYNDRLSLPNAMIVGEALFQEKLKESAAGGAGKFKPTRDFRGRNFAWADFSNSDLRGVDFSPESKDTLNRSRKRPNRTNLEFANLSGALLQRADFSESILNESRLDQSFLHGANLRRCTAIRLMIHYANATGADFNGCVLNFSFFQNAVLIGSRFDGTEIILSNFRNANLTFASMTGAKAYASNFAGAILNSAALNEAELQGANLAYANLNHADLRGAFVYRTRFWDVGEHGEFEPDSFAKMSGVLMSSMRTGPEWLIWRRGGPFLIGDDDGGPSGSSQRDGAEMTAAERWAGEYGSEFDSIDGEFQRSRDGLGNSPGLVLGKDRIISQDVTELRSKLSLQSFVSENFEKNFNESMTEQDIINMIHWNRLSELSSQFHWSFSRQQEHLFVHAMNLICGPNEDAEFVARRFFEESFTFGSILYRLGDKLDEFRTRLRQARNDAKSCPGVEGLTKADWRRLDEIQVRGGLGSGDRF